jgi:23S rRNA pseudouridine2605 synthase
VRLNKLLSENTRLSRRKADEAISAGLVTVNGKVAKIGQSTEPSDVVEYNHRKIGQLHSKTTIMLNKPRGYVCSRNGQGSKTIYSLIPLDLHGLNPVGRLDKDSSGLLLMTNDGELLNNLAHPSNKKDKVYIVKLEKPLDEAGLAKINNFVILEDGPSKMKAKFNSLSRDELTVTLQQGRNRQIRRTFEKLGYKVIRLERISFGNYQLGNLGRGKYILK